MFILPPCWQIPYSTCWSLVKIVLIKGLHGIFICIINSVCITSHTTGFNLKNLLLRVPVGWEKLVCRILLEILHRIKFWWLYLYYLVFLNVVRIYNTTSCSILKVSENYDSLLASIYFIMYLIIFYEHAIMKNLVLNRLMRRLFEQIYPGNVTH